MTEPHVQVHVEEFPGQRVCILQREIDRTQIGAFLGEAFAAVAGRLAEVGAPPSGPPVARYDMADGRFIVQAGFPIDGDVPRESIEVVDGVCVDEFAACTVATLAFQGPFEQIPTAYQQVSAWMGEHGYRPDGRPWEQYLDGPEAALPRTVVRWPCAQAEPEA